MLPLLDATTANANPKFEALYNDLCKNKLNSDASSILDNDASKQRDAAQAEVFEAKLCAARRDVIIAALKEIAYSTASLSDELRELIVIAAIDLEGQIVGEDFEAVQDAKSRFKTQMPVLSKALKTQIQDGASKLDKLINTSSPDTAIPIDTLKLWRALVNNAAASVAELDVQSIATTLRIHETSQQIMKVCVQLLEQTLHGAVSRAVKAKADYLTIVAEGMSKKLDIQYSQLLTQVDTASARRVLEHRDQDLTKQNRVLTRQLRHQTDALDDLKSGLRNDARAAKHLSLHHAIRSARSQIVDADEI